MEKEQLAREEAARAEADRAREELEHTRRALARTQEDLARLAALVEFSQDAIIGKTLDGIITSWNPAAERIYGYSAEEAVGKPISMVIPRDRSNELSSVLERIRRGERVEPYETVRVRKDGALIHMSVGISPMLDSAGRIVGAASIARDITERKQSEAERERLLSEVERRAAQLAATINSIADGVVIYAPTGEILLMNSAAERMLGFSLGSPEARRPIEQRVAAVGTEIDGKPFPVEKVPAWRALRGETVQGTVMITHPEPGRTYWISASAAPIITPEGTMSGAVSTFTDITRLRELQEQRDLHILSISHGLRTPLTVIQGQAQLIHQVVAEQGLDGRLHHSADAIVASSRRMGLILRDLVDLTSLESQRELKLNREAVDLKGLVVGLKDRLEGVLDMDRIRIEAPDRLDPVLADPDRVERILVNLLSNALRYSDPHSEVVVSLAERDGEVLTSVTNRGRGIPKEKLPSLFERYQRVKVPGEPREGLGIGLYISKGLVEAHGGRLQVVSDPGKTTTFSFTLPVVER